MRIRSRRWSVTLNNYTEEEESTVQSLVSRGLVKYLVYGREVGEQNTPHLQMYLETSGKVSLSSIKKIPGLSRCHAEKSRGSFQRNRDYCTKEGNFIFEEGSPMQQGARSDLDEVKSLLDDGKSLESVADQHFSTWVRYHRSFQIYKSMKSSPRNWKTLTHVYWGKTGTGKTRFVMDQVMDDPFWIPGDYKWFDGYDGQPIVILDDYRGEYPLQLLLKLLDRYPMSVPVKGAFTNWCPRKVYITSNIHPREWYPQADSFSVAAMFRRISLLSSVFNNIYE